MKRSTILVLAAFFAAALGYSMSYYALEVRGGSRILALDQPVRKGRVLVFHRYPDGVYMSLSASEVEKVVTMDEPPPREAGALAPGQEVFIGGTRTGPNFEAPPAAVAAEPPPAYQDYGYGYYGSYWGGGYVPPRPPVPHPLVPPSRIGPNGYPILAPPGAAGSAPLPIGPNGYPILAPLPPVPAPRMR